MDDEGESYHFTAGDQPVSEALAAAIPFVRGVDPCELDPLATVVDPDALDRLFAKTADGLLSFTWNGLDVEIHANGDIRIADSGSASSIQQQLDTASNILLFVPPRNNVACHELVTELPIPRVNVLEVLFSSSVDERVARWIDRRGDSPTNTAILTVGDIFRSSGSRSGVADASVSVTLDTVSDCRDLDAILATIDDHLSAWADDPNQSLLCFESVPDVLHTTTRVRSIGFFRQLTRRVKAADATAHYHLDPNETDRELVDELVPLFDAVIDADDDGTLSITA